MKPESKFPYENAPSQLYDAMLSLYNKRGKDLFKVKEDHDTLVYNKHSNILVLILFYRFKDIYQWR